MDKFRERVCCIDLERCQQKMSDATTRYGMEKPFTCITQHPGFDLICLHWEPLELAWSEYKRQYGRAAYDNGSDNKRYRHIAYRQLAKFLFGVVGREIRYVLPSCAVNKIRETFPPLPNEEITGFKFHE